MVCEARLKTHGPGVDDGLMAHGRERLMTVDDGYLFPKHDGPEYWEEAVQCRGCCFLEDDHDRNVVYFQAVGQAADSCPVAVGVSDDDNLMSPLYEPL